MKQNQHSFLHATNSAIKGRSSQNFFLVGGGLAKFCKTPIGEGGEGGAKIQNHERFCRRKGGKPGWRGVSAPLDSPLIM